jgi:hypothetical protein
MSEDAAANPGDALGPEDEGYVAPAPKALNEIIAADTEDESLQRYKAALLGSAASGDTGIVVKPDDPRNVIVQKIWLVVEGREDQELDLTKPLSEIKKTKFTLKEGIKLRTRIEFIVQREIVTGLKYIQKTKRMGMSDTLTHMVGSYPPKETPHSFTTPEEDIPHGTLARGTYTVHSLFTDDDKNEHLKWEWQFELKKDWA